MNFSFIIPCHNEGESLLAFYEELVNVVNTLQHDVEIIFINDGSKDNTLELIIELSEKDERVGYIDFSRNFGKEAAIIAGLEQSSGDAVFLMDADLQDPPKLIPEMIEELKSGFDCVYTRRVTRKGEPIMRTLSAKMFYIIMNIFCEVKTPQGTRDYRVMSRSYVNSIIACQERNRFSKGLFSWVGFNMKCIDFENEDRFSGTSSWSFKRLFTYGLDGIISFSITPLRFSTIIGSIITFFAFIFLAYIVIRTLVFRVPPYDQTFTVSLLILFSGVQLLSIGILGEYVGRIFNEIKARPIYIPKQTHISRMTADRKDNDSTKHP